MLVNQGSNRRLKSQTDSKGNLDYDEESISGRKNLNVKNNIQEKISVSRKGSYHAEADERPISGRKDVNSAADSGIVEERLISGRESYNLGDERPIPGRKSTTTSENHIVEEKPIIGASPSVAEEIVDEGSIVDRTQSHPIEIEYSRAIKPGETYENSHDERPVKGRRANTINMEEERPIEHAVRENFDEEVPIGAIKLYMNEEERPIKTGQSNLMEGAYPEDEEGTKTIYELINEA